MLFIISVKALPDSFNSTPTIIKAFSEEIRNIVNSYHLNDKSGQLWNLTPAIR